MEKHVFICEDSLEGIFTAVYVAWDSRCGHRNVEIRTEEPENLELFCRYLPTATDQEKAVKVARTIRRDLGEQFYEFICYAAAARDSEKGTAIYRTLAEALSQGRKNRRVLENLANAHIRHVFQLHKRIWYEVQRFYGFVRFRELPGGILFARIKPDNDILSLLNEHFSGRYPGENWMIYDEGRGKALIHPAGEPAYIRSNLYLKEKTEAELANPEKYEILWKQFCESIAVKERTNPKLQQHFVPLKYRGNMLEFQEETW